jgi:hypothetical protein
MLAEAGAGRIAGGQPAAKQAFLSRVAEDARPIAVPVSQDERLSRCRFPGTRGYRGGGFGAGARLGDGDFLALPGGGEVV